jgi:hypothetical protein
MTRQSHADQMAAINKWLADHPAPPKPYDVVTEERMAHVANGGTLRSLPTDPAVRGECHPWRREGDNVSTDGGFSWHYEPYSDGAA